MGEDTRLKLLEAGAKLIHRQGFNNTGIQEILKEAGVPKGSFYFYFASKEEFGLELIDYYGQTMAEEFFPCLSDPGRPPLERLRAIFKSFHDFYDDHQFSLGCPIGNLCQEMSDLSPAMRLKLEEAIKAKIERMAAILSEAQDAGQLAPGQEPYKLAAFMVAAWQGSLLVMKAKKTDEPLKTFDQVVFDDLLNTTAG